MDASRADVTPRLIDGGWGWLLLALLVGWWDSAPRRRESMSRAYYRAVRKPMLRWPVMATWAITSAHLFGFLPRKYDPFLWVGRTIRRSGAHE